MTEVSDPGNVSALSSEVEVLIEEALETMPRLDASQKAIGRPILRELVRKALATVEADAASKQIGLNLYEARMQRLEEQARALAEALREMEAGTPTDSDHCRYCIEDLARHAKGCPVPYARKALASWDTSQKESR